MTKAQRMYKLVYDDEIIATSPSRDDLNSMRHSFVQQGIAEFKELRVKVAKPKDVEKFNKSTK